MAREKLGVAIFAGLLGATALVSSGQFFDANKLLEKWSGTPVEAPLDAADEPAENTQAASKEPAPAEETIVADEKPAAGPLEPAQPVEKAADEELAKTAEQAAETAAEPAPEAEVNTAQSDDAQPPAVAAETQPIVPSFDILRVEPDGSTLIAGLAAPNSQVELVAGSNTLTKTTANERGEFVAILDDPLEKGDYEIVLRATAPDGDVVTSAETAIVSIPEKGSDQVLALVEAPGAPSRLITKPNAVTALTPVEEAEQPTDQPDVAAVEPQAEQSETENTETAKVEPEAAGANKPDAAEEATTATDKDTAKAAAPEEAETPVRIEAVEIDGPSVFVAGAAKPGARIRLYANEILLGDTIASSEGRFLVEVRRELPVGDYVIRADSLGANGVDVLMRAAVPFTRSEGEKLAAIAVPAAPALPDTPPDIPVEETQESVAAVPEKPAVEPAVQVADPEAVEQAETTQPAAPETEEILAERLQPVNDSVIIRRGDTLWQISRRVYGRGIKFTTIYDANQAQIKDPNMIWPGQVFDLPEPTETQDN